MNTEEKKIQAITRLKKAIEGSIRFKNLHCDGKPTLFWSSRPSSKSFHGFLKFYVIDENGPDNVTGLVATAFGYKLNKKGEIQSTELDCLLLAISEKCFDEQERFRTADYCR